MHIISLAIVKLALVAFLGFFLYRKKYIEKASLEFLTFFVIHISIPFLIFSHLIESLKGVSIHNLGVFLAISFFVFFAGIILGLLFSFKPIVGANRREFISGVSFQNAGYLPMNIAVFLFPPDLREKFLVYIFLYLLGFNIIMWSVGSYFIFKSKGDNFKLKSIFTPPVLSTVAAVILVYTSASSFIPHIILVPMRMIGDTSFVFSMIILGCWLAQVSMRGVYRRLICLGWLSFLKLMVMPLIFLVFIIKFGIFSLLGLFILLQAAMPSAASLPIIVDLRGADSEFISKGVFITHLLSIFTIPFWVGIFLQVSGFTF
ncbi:MAG: AEC family transporter [Candidatus Omnitrophota bacterium]|nr:MAG: AEC family transporter [Candidatus Omnitrophota bacterium]